jgi:ABC-type multidrug transport system fused ATPase/permease subunit
MTLCLPWYSIPQSHPSRPWLTRVVQDDKLDHLVVDEESFSKGQQQLLCLARALLGKKKIIVLDESTSRRVHFVFLSSGANPKNIFKRSMDHITNEKICHVVDTQMQGLTVLAIAHRICMCLLEVILHL